MQPPQDINIVILDDELLLAETVSAGVQDFGYKCVYFTNSQTTLDYLKEHEVHLILLDILLNETIDGIGLIPAIKEINAEIIIIMLSGEYKLEVAIKALRTGAYDYILKPIDFPFLKERLRLAVQKIKSDQLSKIYFHAIFHDLKNPVATLSLLTDTFQELPAYEKDESFKMLVHMGKKNVEAIIKMISNLLRIEKFTAGVYKVNKETFNVKECINEALQIFKPISHDEPEALTIDFALPEGLQVNTDKEIYQHILYNLVSNGQKHCEPNTQLAITVTLVDNSLKTSVKNKGSYIEEQYQNMIFSKFVQLDDRRNTTMNFGIGLTFSKVAVEALGGRIWVESEKEANETTFIYMIPVEIKNQPA